MQASSDNSVHSERNASSSSSLSQTSTISTVRNKYDEMINLTRLKEFQSSVITKPTRLQCKKTFYEEVYKKFDNSISMKNVTTLIMSSHYFVLVQCPFYSGVAESLDFLCQCFVDFGILDEDNKSIILKEWANCVVETNSKLTLSGKWDKIMRQIRQGISTFHIQNVLAPHPHLFGNSAANYSHQIYRYFQKSGVKVSTAMFHTKFAQDTCREWMSFERQETPLGIHWKQNERFVGPFENVIALRERLMTFMGRLSIEMAKLRRGISTDARFAFAKLTSIDSNKSKLWMLEVVNFIKTYGPELTAAFEDSYLIDDGNEIVMELDDYILRLQMAGMIIPKESKQDVANVAPLEFSEFIVDFTKKNKFDKIVDKTSMEFVEDINFEYLAWYHSVSLFNTYILLKTKLIKIVS